MKGNYDFCGWASRNDLRCRDGRTIRKNAFKVNDGKKVPLVWNHQHNSIDEVLGHAVLENRDEGVYAYCKFNANPAGAHAKECVHNGDVESLSIWANDLDQVGNDVVHGTIREVSLVLAGANPGAFIESVMSHGVQMDDFDEEGIFYTGDDIFIEHSIDKKDEKKKKLEDDDENAEGDDDMTDEEKKKKKDDEEELKHSDDNKDDKEPADTSEKTVGEVMNTLNEDQKKAVAIVIGQILEEEKPTKEDEEMKHNLFEGEDTQQNTLSHSDMQKIFADAKRLGSLREAVNQNFEEGGVLAHSIDTTGMETSTGTQTYGFNDVDMFFPEYRTINGATPEWISRNMDWVQGVISGVHRTPFARIKSQYADITEDEARARGYIKGKQKKEEVFTTLKRTTDPQTIYKKQKLDRDDILSITDFDIVAWIKAEMRIMLNEEIARAILIGDGRPADSDDKIQENHIRPIVKDVPLFNVMVPVTVPTNADSEAIARATINTMIRSRKLYKGSGNPTFYSTEDVLTEMLLIEDGIGHKLYKTEGEVATAIRVSRIQTVEPMENYTIDVNGTSYPLIGTAVNLKDYNVGTDRGGEISLFDDFDIDYNQYKYLMETRMSGALIKPFSALTYYLVKE